jgi:hypothetical protein
MPWARRHWNWEVACLKRCTQLRECCQVLWHIMSVGEASESVHTTRRGGASRAKSSRHATKYVQKCAHVTGRLNGQSREETMGLMEARTTSHCNQQCGAVLIDSAHGARIETSRPRHDKIRLKGLHRLQPYRGIYTEGEATKKRDSIEREQCVGKSERDCESSCAHAEGKACQMRHALPSLGQ